MRAQPGRNECGASATTTGRRSGARAIFATLLAARPPGGRARPPCGRGLEGVLASTAGGCRRGQRRLATTQIVPEASPGETVVSSVGAVLDFGTGVTAHSWLTFGTTPAVPSGTDDNDPSSARLLRRSLLLRRARLSGFERLQPFRNRPERYGCQLWRVLAPGRTAGDAAYGVL